MSKIPLLLLVLALTACATGSMVSTPPSPDPQEFLRAVDELRQAAKIPGLSVVVVKDGKVVASGAFGYTDFEKKIPATLETTYDIGSVAKPISAVVALRLVELGVLDLDRPMAEYSGWKDFCEGFSEAPSIFARGLRCDPPVHTERQLLSHTAVGVPGTSFSYNPPLYSWASRPMMAVTKEQFSSLVKKYVFEPAKMTRSARRYRDLPLPPEIATALAPPHHLDESGRIVRSPALEPQGDGAAGGVVTTAEDLARFDIALDRGELISAASREAMMTPALSTDGKPLPYGLGFFIQDYRGHKLVWHSGLWEQAYSALYLKVPDQNVTLILLADSDGIWWDNPLDKAEVEKSPFARLFLRTWVVSAVRQP